MGKNKSILSAELKEAKRQGISPEAFELFQKEHSLWLRQYLSMNDHGKEPLAKRKVKAYLVWKKFYGYL